MKTIKIIFLIVSFSLSFGCSSQKDTGNLGNVNSNANAENNAANSNLEELKLLINVPFETEDLVWKKDDDGKKLVAVMRFSPEDADRIAEDSGPSQGTASISPESWYPSELTAQSETSGNNGLDGSLYDPKLYFLPPYTKGRLIRIEGTNYFLLELSGY